MVPFASPLAAMKARSSGPNGKRCPLISSARTLATCSGSRAGIDRDGSSDTSVARYLEKSSGIRRRLSRDAREHAKPRRNVVARMDGCVLRRDAKISRPSSQRRTFVHGPVPASSSQPSATRTQAAVIQTAACSCFRHAGHVGDAPWLRPARVKAALRHHSLGILPNAGELSIKQRACRHELASGHARPSLKRSVSTNGVVMNGYFDAGQCQFHPVHDGALGDPHGESGMRQHEDLGELGKDGIRRDKASNGNSKKFESGTNASVNATWWLPEPLRPNVCQVSRISLSAGIGRDGASGRVRVRRRSESRPASSRSARDPLGVLAAAGKRPCAGNLRSARNALGRADRLTRTGNNVILSVAIDLLTQVLARQKRRRGPDVADHRRPAH